VIAEAGPDFGCGMEEVLEGYVRPYNPEHPVVCLDESPKQLISERRQSVTEAKGIEHIRHYVKSWEQKK
jgi:hypothetical protein